MNYANRRTLAAAALILSSVGCSLEVDGPGVSPPGGMSAASYSHLNSVITVMQASSVHRAKINWVDVRSQAFAAAGAAQSIPETYPGIRVALAALGDGHSFYEGPDRTMVFVRMRTCQGSNATVPTNIPENIGYVKVGAFAGTSAPANAFATDIQNAISHADRAELTGWIVDLRGNVGGNMWPMIAGLGPILGDGKLGWFIDAGSSEQFWEYRDGAALLNGSNLASVSAPYTLRNSNPKVAVLVDNAVASSGEATFIAFRKRPKTRSFGLPTCGLSTANRAFALDGGARLVLTVSLMADREKTIYGDQLEPDERLTNQTAVVDRAIEWIRSTTP